jgi:hypothetical protein
MIDLKKRWKTFLGEQLRDAITPSNIATLVANLRLSSRLW